MPKHSGRSSSASHLLELLDHATQARPVRIAEIKLPPGNSKRLVRERPSDKPRGGDAQTLQECRGPEVVLLDETFLAAPFGLNLFHVPDRFSIRVTYAAADKQLDSQ